MALARVDHLSGIWQLSTASGKATAQAGIQGLEKLIYKERDLKKVIK